MNAPVFGIVGLCRSERSDVCLPSKFRSVCGPINRRVVLPARNRVFAAHRRDRKSAKQGLWALENDRILSPKVAFDEDKDEIVLPWQRDFNEAARRIR